MKRSIVSVLLLAATVAAVNAAGIKWAKAYDSAKSEAKSSGKLMMIDMYTDWCVWCKKLDSDTYPNPAVVTQSEKFIPLKLNAEKDAEGIRLAKKFKVDGYPTVLFIDADENLAYKIVGYAPGPDFAASMGKAATIRQDKAKFKKALTSNPADFDALVGLAGIYASTGEITQAAELTDSAANLVPAGKKGALLDAFNATGDGFQNANQFPKAISYFEKAIDPAFPKRAAYARISIATCYFSEQQPKQAIPHLEALLKMGKEADEYRSQAQQMLDMAKKGQG